jgi:Dyp-type peroxidase family
MALTLTETRVNNSPQFVDMLSCLQANILKHHGRNAAWHVFLSIKEGRETEAQKWISDFAVTHITSAFKQLVDTDNHKKFNIDGGTVFTLSLSATGYTKLGIPQSLQPDDTAFQEGMKARSRTLSDTIEEWEPPYQQQADVLLIIADTNEDVIQQQTDALLQTASSVFELLKVEKGKALKNSDNVGIEHFGYADGISQPLFMEEELLGRTTVNWDDEAPLKLALIKDKSSNNADRFGSYIVFRKLEQNVKAFKAAEKTFKVANASGVLDDELPGAMLVGRFEGGTPTLVSDHDTKSNTNDFNYTSTNGKPGQDSKCPFHSHIRITNPRADVSNTFAHQVRLVRRGIPFDEIGRPNLDVQPTGGVGLLFMCYQASIVKQFEFIQQRWVNEGEIGSGRFVGQDGLIGQGPNTFPKTLPKQWGKDTPTQACNFSNPESGFVKMRGGEYFFTPSVCFLKELFTGSVAGVAQSALL